MFHNKKKIKVTNLPPSSLALTTKSIFKTLNSAILKEEQFFSRILVDIALEKGGKLASLHMIQTGVVFRRKSPYQVDLSKEGGS